MLLSLVLFIYFKTTVTIVDADIVPKEAEPVKKYIEGCMQKAVDDAITLIGLQGGFIKIPTNIAFSSSRYVNPDGLGIVKIPYWFYKGSRYNPTIESVQKEISQYVEENTASCLNNFEVFSDQYRVAELGKMDVEVTLNKEDISVFMKYPIRIHYLSNNSNIKIESYFTKVDVGLRKVIEVANKLLDAELRGVFLENFTIDLMASNPDIPFTDMKFDCKTFEWHINDVKERLNEMLYYNIPRIRIKDTNYFPFLENEAVYEKLLEYNMENIANGDYPENVPEDAYEYLHMFWNVGLDNTEDISVGLSFIPEVGTDLIGRPHDNGVLRSKVARGGKDFIDFFCVNIYHFTYDINYPVLVTIIDEDSHGGEGYFFNFALPVTIINNEPYKSDYGYDMFTTSYVDEGFCDERREKVTDIRVYGNEDGFSNVELDGVNVSLQCFRYYCGLGQTKADGGVYRLRTALPSSCSNPFLIAEKEGYIPSKKQVLDDDMDIDLDLIRLKKLDYHVVFHRYNSIGKVIENEKELEEDMEVSIQILNENLQQYKLFPLEGDVSHDIDKIELIEDDVEYDVDIVLMQGEEYAGGYRGKWKVSGEEVADSDMVIFHVLKYVPMPYTKEDKLMMVDFILNGDYEDEVAPELE